MDGDGDEKGYYDNSNDDDDVMTRIMTSNERKTEN